MDQRTRDLILTAWRENRLVAVHIDLQTIYNQPGTEKAFAATRKQAEFMRTISVPNVWVAMNLYQKPAITTVKAYNEKVSFSDEAISPLVGAHDDETLIIKNVNSAFSHPFSELHQHLLHIGKDTPVMGGVYADLCMMETLRDAVLADRYNVVAALDAINTSPRIDYPNLVRLRCNKPDTFKRNFFSATTQDIRETLVPAQDNNNPPRPHKEYDLTL